MGLDCLPSGSRPFGADGPQRLPAPKKAAQPKSKGGGKPSGDGGGRGRSRNQDDAQEEDGKSQDEAPGKGPKKRRQKADPQVSARLSALEVEKNVLLTTDKWVERVKALNIEVTESIQAAKAYPQTRGLPGFLFFVFFGCCLPTWAAHAGAREDNFVLAQIIHIINSQF